MKGNYDVYIFKADTGSGPVFRLYPPVTVGRKNDLMKIRNLTGVPVTLNFPTEPIDGGVSFVVPDVEVDPQKPFTLHIKNEDKICHEHRFNGSGMLNSVNVPVVGESDPILIIDP